MLDFETILEPFAGHFSAEGVRTVRELFEEHRSRIEGYIGMIGSMGEGIIMFAASYVDLSDADREALEANAGDIYRAIQSALAK